MTQAHIEPNQKEIPMKKFIITTAILLAIAAPAIALASPSDSARGGYGDWPVGAKAK